jgi:hypothetical protein
LEAQEELAEKIAQQGGSVIAVALRLLVSAWLIYLAASDLRRGEAANWATVPPLFAAVAWRVAVGDWILVAALAVVLAVAEWPQLWSLGVAGAAVSMRWAIPQGVEVVVAAWTALLALWSIGVLGGADVKAMMALAALFPDARLAWMLLVAHLALSLIYLVRRHGRGAPLAVWSVATGARSPTENPALPAVALAGITYVWFVPFQFPVLG